MPAPRSTRSGKAPSTPIKTPVKTPKKRRESGAGGESGGGGGAAGERSGGHPNVTIDLDSDPDPDEALTQDAFWKAMITPEDIDAVNSTAGNEQEFRTLARHFWNRAFFFQRRWSTADQNYVYDRMLSSVPIQNRSRLKILMDEAMFAAEEAYCKVVIEFAEYWLLTPSGEKYKLDVKEARYAWPQLS